MVRLGQQLSLGNADSSPGTGTRENQQVDFEELLRGLSSLEQLSVLNRMKLVCLCGGFKCLTICLANPVYSLGVSLKVASLDWPSQIYLPGC